MARTKRIWLLLSLGVMAACQSAPLNTADMNFRNPDGSLDTSKLTKVFGGPNTNLDLNPTAIDVAQTSGARGVSILSDRLVFKDAAAAWLKPVEPGYTLFCSHVCGDHGFLRRVVSVQPSSAGMVVLTVPAGIGDVVRSGWLQADVPITFPAPPPAHKPTTGGSSGSSAGSSTGGTTTETSANGVKCSLSDGGSCDFTLINDTITNTFALPALKDTSSSDNAGGTTSITTSGSGTITTTFEFQSHLLISVVVGQDAAGNTQTNLVSFEITGTPSVGLTATATLSETFKQTWTPFPQVKLPFGVFFLGPVEVTPELVVTTSIVASIGGSLTGTASAGAAVTAGLGFEWNRNPPKGAHQLTPKTDWSPIFDANVNSLAGNGSATATASATASLGFSLAASIQLLVADVLGPEVGVTAGLGIEGSAKVSAGVNGTINDTGGDIKTDCSAGASADIYLQTDINVGGSLNVFNIKDFTISVPIYSPPKWTYPSPPWQIALPKDITDLCATNAKVNFIADAGAGACATQGSYCASDSDCCADLYCDVESPQLSSCQAVDIADGSGICLDLASSCALDGGYNCCSGEVCDPGSLTCLAAPASQASATGGACVCSSDGVTPCPDGTTLSSCCSNGQQDCGDGQGCHDVSVDGNNCGGCGVSCTTLTGDPNSSCTASVCSCTCPGGQACPTVNGSATSSNCAVATQCAAGTADCAQTGQCQTDTTSDRLNCGGCNVQCTAGSGNCANSQCLCADNATPCSDPTCASCAVQCPVGTANCGDGSCDVSTATDPANCGGCNVVCANGSGSCLNGQCLCPDNQTPCSDATCASCPTSGCTAPMANCGDGSCDVDTSSDPNNCGACGNSCASGSCAASVCACASGSAICGDGTCASQTDPMHCGTSACVNCLNQTGSATSTCTGGSCNCLCSDGVTACPDGQNASSCAGASCAPGSQDCTGSGVCNDLTGSDPTNCGVCGNDCTQSIGPSATCDGAPDGGVACACDCLCSGGALGGQACPSCDTNQCY